MTLPALVLGLVYALLIGSAFHVWRNGGTGRLLLYLVLSVAGAAAGQVVGSWQNWSLLPVGPLDFGLITAGSVLFVGLGYWLSLVEFSSRGDE